MGGEIPSFAQKLDVESQIRLVNHVSFEQRDFSEGAVSKGFMVTLPAETATLWFCRACPVHYLQKDGIKKWLLKDRCH